MRTNTNNHLRRSAAGIAASLLLFGLSASAQPFPSPVGDWDVTVEGADDGVAQMHFASDGTFSMDLIHYPPWMLRGSSSSTASRGGDDSRGGSLTNSGPTSLPTHTNLHGGLHIPVSDTIIGSGDLLWLHRGHSVGHWGFDVSGRLIGFFADISAPLSITTNVVQNQEAFDNGQISVAAGAFITNVEYLRITNAISFTGKVTSNSRLTLLCSTPNGKATYRGLPPIQLPDLSGSWYGTKIQQGLPYNDFFTLSNPDSLFTIYTVSGEGPSYIYDSTTPGLGGGTTIVTRQKKMGFALQIVRPHLLPPTDAPDRLVIRAVTGRVNPTRATFSGRGVEDADLTVDPITFKAFRPLTLPPD